MHCCGYPLGKLHGDVFGGITAGIVALPLALAFGVASGAGPAAGLFGAIALGFFAAVFGGTRTQISGPTGPMTIVAASAIAAFPGDFQAVLAVFFLCGLVQVILGSARLGGFVRFMPYPVVSGFMNGIGIIIILLQIQPILGSPSLSSPLAAVLNLGETLAALNLQALMLGAMTMAIVFFCPARITRVLPSPLIALIAGTGLAWFMHLDVATIGPIPSSLPVPSFPTFDLSQFSRIISLGMALAALGTLDSLLTSVVADSLTSTRHNSNRELIGQGIGNMAASLIGGLPGAGATMRTVVNIKAGGTTRLSGAIHSLFLVALLLGLGPLASHIPMAVLAGILVKVGLDIIDYRLLSLVRKAPRTDLVVMAVVFFVTVFVDLIVAVGVGVTLAAVMVAIRTARQASIDITGPEDDAANGDLNISKQTNYDIQVITIRGPFFFGTSANMQERVVSLLETKAIVINCLEVPFMDISAVFALNELVRKLRHAGSHVVFAVSERHRTKLLNLGIGDHVDQEMLQPDMVGALDLARSLARR